MEQKINKYRNIIFIHIPKNAGTSIAEIFGIRSSHIKAIEINQRNPNLLSENFSFGIVRNPIDRFISLYNYARLEKSHYHNNIDPGKSLYGRHLDFELLKTSTIEKCAHYLVENKLKHDTSWNHWDPQYTWLYDKDGDNCLVKKIYRIEKLDELEKDLELMLQRKIRIPYFNNSSNKTSAPQINSKTKALLEDYFRKDFELFNYEF